jgi:hypothetical protein
MDPRVREDDGFIEASPSLIAGMTVKFEPVTA